MKTSVPLIVTFSSAELPTVTLWPGDTLHVEYKPALPRHPRDYDSYYDEELHEELVWLICPKCKAGSGTNDCSWDALEAGSQHKCEAPGCGYEWVSE